MKSNKPGRRVWHRGRRRCIQEAENHFEAYSESFKKTGTTKEKMVAAYKAERERKPGLTAKDFLNIR